MGPVIFEHGGRRVQIQPGALLPSWRSPPARDADGSWRVLSQADVFSMRSVLRQFVFSNHDCSELRELIGDVGGLSASRLSDEQVIDTVAKMLASRRLVMLEQVRNGDLDAKRQVMRAATVKYTPCEPAMTPSQFKQPPSLADAPAALEPSHAAEESFVVNVDHDVQAGVLKVAAEHGVPFCEMCEKAKQARVALRPPLTAAS